jgi:hypothetical protein
MLCVWSWFLHLNLVEGCFESLMILSLVLFDRMLVLDLSLVLIIFSFFDYFFTNKNLQKQICSELMKICLHFKLVAAFSKSGKL